MTLALQTQLRRGTTELCVLALLRDQPLYGSELCRRMTANHGLPTSPGTLYPVLARLAHQGLVRPESVRAPAGSPRRYYALTPRGREALDSLAVHWRHFRNSVDEIVAASG